MTEVQSALYNQDILDNLSKSIFYAYKNFEEHENITEFEIKEDSTGPIIEEEATFISKIVHFFYEILESIINVLKRLYYSLKEILPLIFDKFIEYLLIYSKTKKKQLNISFEQIFEIFQLFGLGEIYPETFDKINAALQWKICSDNWIDINFLYSYKNSLLSNTPVETFQAINDLIELLMIIEKEIEINRIFKKDVSLILEF